MTTVTRFWVAVNPARTLETLGGSVALQIPLNLNEPPGTYALTFRDVGGGDVVTDRAVWRN